MNVFFSLFDSPIVFPVFCVFFSVFLLDALFIVIGGGHNV